MVGIQASITPVRRRFVIALGSVLPFVIALILVGWASGLRARTTDPTSRLRFVMSFPAARSAQPLDGRVLLFISDDDRTEPRMQSDQYRANSTRPTFGVDVDALEPGQEVVIDGSVAGW